MNPAEAITAPVRATAADPTYTLACLELRGGNQRAEYSANLPGLSGWISCHPLEPAQHGGDLYYMSACSEGIAARVVLADVAGHGEVVSQAAGVLKSILLQHVDHWDQSALVRELNESFLQNSAWDEYATAFLASYYAVSGMLLFTNAGHLPPLWYRAATGTWSFLVNETPQGRQVVNLPIGMIPGTTYSQTAVQIEVGDMLIVYTDGITEATNEEGEELGSRRLLALARELPVKSSADAGRALLKAVRSFRGSAPAEDDETVVVMLRCPKIY